ncbi:flavodoxin-dependent (E)-4-hydroxy-3-methylbut-2-enyl-diphosphate synthase, partial [bacterium]
VHQIKKLEDAGCEIIRVSVPTPVAAENLGKIKKQIRIPLVADVHFNYRLALMAVKNGADKIRINPGNIGSRKRVESILQEAHERGIPVRIGVNAGSLEKRIIKNYGGITAEGLVESALNHLMICEDMGFQNIVVSIKASRVPLMIEANRLLSEKIPYPIHLGVTEAGSVNTGVLRSAVGIGALLSEGIGDTIRISLTGDPVEEVKAGYEILKTLHLRKRGLTIISCPTCGRTEINVVSIIEKIEQALGNSDLPITIAVMGCAVNGPGEAREADIGVACGKHDALLFRKGEVIRKIKEEEIVPTLVEEVVQWSE